jgi:hypothetical protein
MKELQKVITRIFSRYRNVILHSCSVGGGIYSVTFKLIYLPVVLSNDRYMDQFVTIESTDMEEIYQGSIDILDNHEWVKPFMIETCIS